LSDDNHTTSQTPSSTASKTKSVQNITRFVPVQNTSNVVIANPDQEEEQQLSSSSILPPQQAIPLQPSLTQSIQQLQIDSLPTYLQEPSVIQSDLLFPSILSALEYPQAPSLIQLLQNLPSLAPTYPEAPSLIQSQQLLQNLPLALQTPLYYQLLPNPYFIPSNPVFTPLTECLGLAECFRGIVTSVVDGDTLDVDGIPVRLSLVDTPERGQVGYLEALNFVWSVCGVGTEALVDEDDGQIRGGFGRLIGVIYCGGNIISLNELLLQGGYAVIDQSFCGISEFSTTTWALRYGCGLVL
jgi:hypothetical protein